MTPEEFADALDAHPLANLAEWLMAGVTLDVLEEVQRATPVKTGALRRSLRARVEQGGQVGHVETDLDYAPHAHYPTRPHVIRAKGRALRWSTGGKTYFAKSVNHPGTKGRPFMDIGLRNSRAAIEARLAQAGYRFYAEVTK